MRTIDEIKADIDYYCEKQRHVVKNQDFTLKIKELGREFIIAVAGDIHLDRLEEICTAERDGLLKFAQMSQQDHAELAEYRKAKEEGRLKILPVFEESDSDGLKVKYRVFKARNGEPVENCFVLRPDKDIAARSALLAYAASTENEELEYGIYSWIEDIEAADEALKGAKG